MPVLLQPGRLERGGNELTTAEWKKVLTELAEIGVLQIYFSGGEPTARKDLVELVRHASDVGLYSNLITSAVLLTRAKLEALADAGLCHVQISFQGNELVVADRMAGLKDAHRKKLEAARWTRELDLPLTVNAVMHRQNLHQLTDIIQMAVDLDADRLEVANVQYYGWALKNRAALMPTVEQIEETSRIVDEAASAAERHPRHRLRDSRLLRAAPEEMHGRLGPPVLQHLAAGQGPALPCRGDHHRLDSNRCDRTIRSPGSGRTPSLQALSRHRLDARAVPELRVQGNRLRRLPLPGFRTDGQCRQHRPGLHAVAAARADFQNRGSEAVADNDRLIYRNFAGGALETGGDMALDAARASSATRSEPFPPLTSRISRLATAMILRGNGRPCGRYSGGLSLWRSRQRLPAGSSPPVRPWSVSTQFCSTSAARAQPPKGERDANTPQHLIEDMETIRNTLGFSHWMVVGGSWGATLALAYAQAHPHRVSGIMLRATFLGTRAELETAFLSTLPRIYPGLYDDFLSVLSEEEKAQPLDAYWRRILDPDISVHGPAARAWYETERILSEHAPNRTQLNREAIDNSLRPLPSTPFLEAHYFRNNCFMQPDQLLANAGKLQSIPGLIVQGRYDFLCPASTAHALAAAWPDADTRIVEGAGHSLYDPGVKDAVMLAIENLASKVAT